MRSVSLSEKLILYYVLLGSAVIISVSAVSFYSTRRALMKRTFDQLVSIRVAKNKQVAQYYSDRVSDVALLAASGFDLFRGETGRTDNNPFRPYMRRYFGNYFLLKDGKVWLSGSFTDTAMMTGGILPPWLPDTLSVSARQRAYVISDMIPDTNGRPRQFIAMVSGQPGSDPAEPGEMVILEMLTRPLISIMLTNDPGTGLGLSGETYLVGADRLMRTESRFRTGAMLKVRVNSMASVNAARGESGIALTHDYRGIRVLSAYEPLSVPGLRWSILAEIDLDEAMIPVYATRSRILLLSILLMVGFFGFVLLIANRITRPLVILRKATEMIGQGRYDIALPARTNDEIGDLTRSFNEMAGQIRETTTQLRHERSGRMRSVFDGEEMERQRLSRELHDGIGQSLIAVKLRLENLLYEESGSVRSSLAELRKYFDQIIDEVRRISNNLMPSVLEVFSIPIAFRNLFTETEEHSRLRIHFEARGDFEDLDKKSKTYIYRLMQEALNNILKHAEASEVWVLLNRTDDQLTLQIRDNGKGFQPDRTGKESGNGIHNMHERAGLLKGTLEILSAPCLGTAILLTPPNILTNVQNQDFPRG